MMNWLPYCNEELIIDIYEEDENICKCGKQFVLCQRNWVEEIK
jgi:hypothetical protein